MALLSRPSLRGSVRRAEGHDTPMESDRHKSSPDCLDTTVEEPTKLRNLKSRSRTRRRVSSSPTDVASPGQLATPTTRANGTGTGVKTARARRDPATPSNTKFFGVHESPDPLDTISPAPSIAPKQRTVTPAIADDTKPPVSPAPRSTRRADHRVEAKAEGALDTSATPAPSDHKEAGDEPEDKRSGRRSLRSTDTGSRCKSELAQYFHNYEQIISLDEPESEFLAAKTTITLIDDLSQPLKIPKPDPTPFGNPLLDLHGCTKLSLPSIPHHDLRKPATDPLNEATYFRAHRKFERQEKQLRNIERNRAQHEQQVLERLLDELRGPDWLRVMGLPNVHETEKKLYEPKREILIQELVTLVNKFQAWKDEERRRKAEKEKDKPDEADPRPRKRSRVEDDGSPAPGELQSTPDPNDVDALAARQLHQEARSAGAAKAKKRKSTSKPAPAQVEEESKSSPKRKKLNPPQPPPAPVPAPASKPAPVANPAPTKNLKQASLSFFWAPASREGPFTSFFRQRHVRDAAIAATKGMRRGGSRSTLAFGHPVPEVGEAEFEVPGDILTEEAILQSQRKRRRLKRKSLG